MAEPVIQLENLSRHYGEKKAVDGLTLSVERGEIFGLLGPNGAGKSTTILMMLGLTEPTSGKVKVCGIDPTRQPILVKKKVGYLPDDVGFYEHMSGIENLMYTAALNRIPPNEARERADKLLERVGLSEAKNQKAGTYSRGMRQRLGLADVLIKQPEVIILDEPTLGIDPEGVREFLNFVCQLSREAKITVLLSSHHLHQVQQVCDRVGIFVKGKLLAVGDISTLSKQLFAQEPYVVEIEVSEVKDELLSSLREIPGVDQVDLMEEKKRIRVYHSQPVTGEISRTLIRHDVDIIRLTQKEYGLDEIYHRYFEGGGEREHATA